MRRLLTNLYDKNPSNWQVGFWVVAILTLIMFSGSAIIFLFTVANPILTIIRYIEETKFFFFVIFIFIGLGLYLPRYKRDQDGVIYDRLTGYIVNPYRGYKDGPNP